MCVAGQWDVVGGVAGIGGWCSIAHLQSILIIFHINNAARSSDPRISLVSLKLRDLSIDWLKHPTEHIIGCGDFSDTSRIHHAFRSRKL
jgi:hypothetical protein